MNRIALVIFLFFVEVKANLADLTRICCGLIFLLVENFCKPAHFFLTSLFFSNQECNFKPAYFCKPAHFFSNQFVFFKPGI